MQSDECKFENKIYIFCVITLRPLKWLFQQNNHKKNKKLCDVKCSHSFAFLFSDATNYAHYVFNTMKQKHSGKISFEVSLSNHLQ